MADNKQDDSNTYQDWRDQQIKDAEADGGPDLVEQAVTGAVPTTDDKPADKPSDSSKSSS